MCNMVHAGAVADCQVWFMDGSEQVGVLMYVWQGAGPAYYPPAAHTT